jgi:glycosyltransferase involved in cell wall biosynthesis
MQAGGAERAMALLVNYLVDEGYDTRLATLDQSDSVDFYSLDKRVVRIGLGCHRAGRLSRLLSMPRTIRSLRRLIVAERPRLVLSLLDVMNIPVLMASIGLQVPVIVAERMDPRFHRFRWVRDRLRYSSYQRADRIVVQTKRVQSAFPATLQSRIRPIPNAVVERAEPAVPDQPAADGRFRIIAVGRLHPQKGFDRLLAAFASLADQFPNWDMVVFGVGPEESRLLQLRANLGLTEQVKFAGLSKEIDEELHRSHIFAFPSHYEGYPNALAEAVAHGLPCIGFADVSGVEELIVDGLTGALVSEDKNEGAEFTDALHRLMADSDLRKTMGEAGRKRIRANRPDAIHKQWRQLIDEVITSRADAGRAGA